MYIHVQNVHFCTQIVVDGDDRRFWKSSNKAFLFSVNDECHKKPSLNEPRTTWLYKDKQICSCIQIRENSEAKSTSAVEWIWIWSNKCRGTCGHLVDSRHLTVCGGREILSVSLFLSISRSFSRYRTRGERKNISLQLVDSMRLLKRLLELLELLEQSEKTKQNNNCKSAFLRFLSKFAVQVHALVRLWVYSWV